MPGQMNGYAMIQTTPSIAITASVAQRGTIVVICPAAPPAPSVVRLGAAPLVIHGIARKIIGVMRIMRMRA
jgi:hypothetical protein